MHGIDSMSRLKWAMGVGEGGVSRALRKMDLYRLRTNRRLGTVCEKYLQGIFLLTGSSPDKKDVLHYIHGLYAPCFCRCSCARIT